MDYFTQAIMNLAPGSEFSYSGDDYSTIKWDVLEGDAPTEKAILDEMKRLVAAAEKAELNLQAKKQEVLAKLGLTAEEVAALLA